MLLISAQDKRGCWAHGFIYKIKKKHSSGWPTFWKKWLKNLFLLTQLSRSPWQKSRHQPLNICACSALCVLSGLRTAVSYLISFLLTGRWSGMCIYVGKKLIGFASWLSWSTYPNFSQQNNPLFTWGRSPTCDHKRDHWDNHAFDCGPVSKGTPAWQPVRKPFL